MSQQVTIKPGSSGSHHPGRPLARRTPSHLSVSIKQPQPHPSSQNPAPDAKPNSGHSSLENNRNSSGESSADAWFERSNNNVPRNQNVIVDGESPFFHHQSSSDSQEHIRDTHDGPKIAFPFRPPLKHKDSSGDSSEEYRSVIDDLTVQNQKLKRKLKKFQQMQDAKMNSDKLFEVRVHGLSANKKRELQETLEKFAMNLSESPKTESGIAESTEDTPNTIETQAGLKKPSSSHTSNRVADSGYGSLAASGPTSGQGSNAPSGSRSQPSGAEVNKARDQSIRSYLHDIPEGLLPQKSSAMTEKARKKLVVRRLEQVFGGKGATLDGHQQPQQQQELSRIAAKDDRSALEASGRTAVTEGRREAPIMENETEDPMDFQQTNSDDKGGPSNISRASSKVVDETDFADPTTPEEQRPTRPLDLDLHRAQVPVENMEYFRHLGFTVPNFDSQSPQATEGGWVYLNLLINMAQLHTVNVTPDFVKHALKDYSQKFELSEDGRKVRWRGGRDITQISSNTESSEGSPQNSPDGTGENTKKRHRLANQTPSDTGGYPSKKQALPTEEEDRLSYKPLFNRQRSSDDDSMADDSSAFASYYRHDNGNSETFASSGMRSSSQTRRKDDGPIIFYNNANFCIDLSGDKRQGKKPGPKITYSPITTSPMGVDRSSRPSRPQPQFIKDRPLNNASINGYSTPSNMSSDPMEELHFPVVPSPRRVTFEEPPEPITLKASGIGGVRPDDNLMIGVTRKHLANGATGSLARPRCVPAHSLPAGLRKARNPHVKETIVSARRTSLAPSIVPPATYAYDPTDSETDGDDDDEGSEMELDDPAKAAPFSNAGGNDSDASSEAESISSTSPEVVSDASDADGAGADDELDFLAQARKIDPATIYAREREYDADMAERLAEEIPAGSSAATAGGGSGFASPVDMDKLPPQQGIDARRVNVKMQKNKQKKSDDSDITSDSEDEEMDDGVERSIAS